MLGVFTPTSLLRVKPKADLGVYLAEERTLGFFLYPTFVLSLSLYSPYCKGCRKPGKQARVGGEQVKQDLALLKNEYFKGHTA